MMIERVVAGRTRVAARGWLAEGTVEKKRRRINGSLCLYPLAAHLKGGKVRRRRRVD